MDWHQWSRCCESFSVANFVNTDLDKTYLISVPDSLGDYVLFRTISPHDKYYKISFYLDASLNGSSSTGTQSKGPDAHEADAEQALAAAWHQGQQAQRQYPLQGQEWDVLSFKKIKKIVHCLLCIFFAPNICDSFKQRMVLFRMFEAQGLR